MTAAGDFRGDRPGLRDKSLGVPLRWQQRSSGQASEADALSTELQARVTIMPILARPDFGFLLMPYPG